MLASLMSAPRNREEGTGRSAAEAQLVREISEQKRVEAALREQVRRLEALNTLGRTLVSELNLEHLTQVVLDAAMEFSGAASAAFFSFLAKPVAGSSVHDNERGGPEARCHAYGPGREVLVRFLTGRGTPLLQLTIQARVVRSDDVASDPRCLSEPEASSPGTAATQTAAAQKPLLRSYLAVPIVSRSGETLAGLFLGHPDRAVFSDCVQQFVVSLAAQAAIGMENSYLYQAAQEGLAERKRAEAALRQTQDVYRAIGESLDYGTWICDPAGRNIYASESFLRLVGLSQEQCSEFGWGTVLHPDDAQRTLEAWKECVRTGQPWDIEHRFLGVDGAYHPVLARGLAVRDQEGKVVCWAGINLDLSRQKQAEAALREADRRKDEFLAVLAHELRNPLAPIRYALAVAKQPGRTAEQREHTEAVIERQVEHMSRLLEDLLDISRITHGALELRKSRIDLASGISAAIEAARPMLDSKQHTLSVELPRHPVYLNVDPVRMAQIFTNLLINAAKYTDPGGEIQLSAWTDGGEIMIAVRDNGIGISAEMKPRLFKAFSQTRPALERADGGLGIGLALVHGLVQLHGGSIEAQSDGQMQGSEFVVRLPLSPIAPEDQAAVASPAESAPTRLRVLIADDNQDNAEVSGTLLELWGHEVHVTHTGKGALELAERMRPEVLLLDIGMPDLNGYDVAAAIRAAAWGQGMILIAVTGWGRDEDRRRALSAGFDHHLTKPVDPAKLRQLLAKL
jgi:PAS domain S-box-containing protein